jgi:mRNA-degrading endonuclease toxin of MazEF toxin-antitoxin module
MTAVWLLLFSCATGSEPTPSHPVLPRSEQPHSNGTAAECIAACIKTNMARAVAPEIIESDCTRSCSSENDGHELIFENQPEN